MEVEGMFLGRGRVRVESIKLEGVRGREACLETERRTRTRTRRDRDQAGQVARPVSIPSPDLLLVVPQPPHHRRNRTTPA